MAEGTARAKRFFSAVLLCTSLAGCHDAYDMTAVKSTSQVEIAPGRWLQLEGGDTVHASDLLPNRKNPHELSPVDALNQALSHGSRSGGAAAERSSLAFEWHGKQVRWSGREIPITLREDDGRLYMIGFNRANMSKIRFAYFRLADGGTAFKKLKAKDFPKHIATQNMWLYGIVGAKWTKLLPELRRLDTEGDFFDWSMTAYIWYQLAKGIERYEMPHRIPRDFLREYVELYHPIALPTLVKETTGSATGDSVGKPPQEPTGTGKAEEPDAVP